MSSRQWLVKSPMGSLYLVASEEGLQGIFWKKQKVTFLKNLNDKSAPTKVLVKTVRQLEEYFAGRRKQFDLPFAVGGTEFQTKVWQALSEIPYGKTVSYRDIAKKIKNEKAVRAVGTANGKNPLCIIVPCHRVIAADGTMGGYAGGIKAKKKLLALEVGKRS